MKLFGHQFFAGSLEDIQQELFKCADAEKATGVFLCNVHMMVEGEQDPDFRQVMEKNDYLLVDGMPIKWSFHFFNAQQVERITGFHLLSALLGKLAAKEQGVFFIGSTVDKLAKLKTTLALRFNNKLKVDTYSPPFRSLDASDMQEMATLLNHSSAKMVFVILGCPKQEKFIHQMKDLSPKVFLGIGNAFEILIGDRKPTPLWMQKAGLEWLYRLFLEPKRLFARYFFTNSYFCWMVLKEIFRKQNNHVHL